MSKDKVDKNAKASELKNSVLETLLATLTKKYGKGAVINMDNFRDDCPSLSTGSLGIDRITGIGGIPKGKITEIYGEESVGKSTLALSLVSNAQKNGEKVLYIDAEHSLDKKRAKDLGVNINELMVSQPSTGEEAIDIAASAIKSGAIGLIVIDSVAALVPEAELEGEISDQNIGLQARMLSKAMRMLNGAITESNTTVVLINQLRSKVNTFGFGGDNKQTTGGNAIKYYASLRLELKRIKNTEKFSQIRIKAVKNKVAPPFQVCEVPLYFDVGFSLIDEVIDLSLSDGKISKSGAWYSMGQTKIGNGRDSVKNYLKSNPEEFNKLLSDLKDVNLNNESESETE